MIPKPLNEIEWSDIDALKLDERMEDDMLEFKQAFSVEENGVETFHSDYTALTKNQRKKANASIAKHVIAFLNGRGGDLILGIQEDSNESPFIKGITPLQNVIESSDRLGRAMAEIIEPHQTALSIRPVLSPVNDGSGILVLRASSSLRAPHRSGLSKNCYVRRGRDSVPMPMDEVQEMSVQRYSWRVDRLNLVEQLYDRFADGWVRRMQATGPRFQARLAYVPTTIQQIALDDQTIGSIFNQKPLVSGTQGTVNINNIFERLGVWKPVLRGKAQANLHDDGVGDYLELMGREIRESGTIIFDAAWRCPHAVSVGTEVRQVVPVQWIVDFLAHCLWSIRACGNAFPSSLPGFLVLRTNCVGPIYLGLDTRGYNLTPFPNGIIELEPFEIFEFAEIDRAFQQLQLDIYAIIEKSPPYILAFPDQP